MRMAGSRGIRIVCSIYGCRAWTASGNAVSPEEVVAQAIRKGWTHSRAHGTYYCPLHSAKERKECGE